MKIKSYAKINLSLDVTGLREDGYHTVETVMQSVDLYDELDFIWQEHENEGMKISITSNKYYLPNDERNLAYKAAALMGERFNVHGHLKIHIDKHIPVAAGLAGGSGNAAATIIALNRMWKLHLNTKELCKIGSVLGADVAFCILSQNTTYSCALGTGVGEILTPLKNGLKRFILLAKPHFGVSTKDVFKGIDSCQILEHPDTDQLIADLKGGNMKEIGKNMVNVLENYTLNEHPEVRLLKEKIANTDYVEKVLMSGSGPTVFAVYSSARAVKKACMAMREDGYEAYWTSTLVRKKENIDD